MFDVEILAALTFIITMQPYRYRFSIHKKSIHILEHTNPINDVMQHKTHKLLLRIKHILSILDVD